jgi:hypothetical protein
VGIDLNLNHEQKHNRQKTEMLSSLNLKYAEMMQEKSTPVVIQTKTTGGGAN